MGRLSAGICCVVGLVGLVPAVASADVGWRTADPPFTSAQPASLMYDPLGTLYAGAYIDQGNARIRTRPRAGAWTELTTPTASVAFPRIGFDGAGNAVYVNISGSTVIGGYKPVGAAFGAPATIGTWGHSGPYPNLVAVNETGEALTAFDDSAGHLAVFDRPPGAGSSFAAVSVNGGSALATGGPGGIFPPEVMPVLDPNGAGVVLYTVASQNGATFKQVTRSSNGAFGAPSDVGTFYSPSLAVNRAGDAVLLSMQAGQPQVYASYRPHGGSFGPLELVATQGVSGNLPVATLTPDGHVIVAYDSRHPGCNVTTPDRITEVSVVERSPGIAGSWAAPVEFDGYRPSLAASDGVDKFVLGFERAVDPCSGGSGSEDNARIVAGFGSGAGGLDQSSLQTVPQGVTAEDQNIEASAAMDRAGNAFLAYVDDFGTAGSRTLTEMAVAYEDGSTPVPPSPTEPTPDPGTPVVPPDTSNPSGEQPAQHQQPDLPPAIPGNGDPSKPPGKIDGLDALGLKATENVNTGIVFKGIPLSASCAGGCSIQADGHTYAVWSYDAPVTASGARKHKVTVKLKRFKATLKAGKRTNLTIPVPKSARVAAKQALTHRGGTLKAVLVIHSSAITKPVTVTVVFKRKR